MASTVSELVDKIAKLERQLLDELDQQQEEFKYKLEGTKVLFDEASLEAHRLLRVAVLPWLLSSKLRHILSIPFIYSMIIPIAIMDITITLYQHICFRLFGIARVDRSKYVVMDRNQLPYLNAIEKFNCLYCGYGNGVMSYSREVIARTEQYWCPIKHARKVVGTHRRYRNFVAYGDSENYSTQLIKLRDDLRED
ncbi:MAG: hypothetical protein DHS20C12_21090 [Pseudohongiella sp.]|nr:MAG: hypothetical protein DHS20C12_21090 [Pseudohongiella sp.]